MSMKIKGRSAVDSLVEIQQGFSQVVTTSNDSIESRIDFFRN